MIQNRFSNSNFVAAIEANLIRNSQSCRGARRGERPAACSGRLCRRARSTNQAATDAKQRPDFHPSYFLLLPFPSLLTKLCVSRIFFPVSPRRNPGKQIARRARDVFDFGHATIARRFPDLPYNQCAVFSHDPAQMMHRCSRSGFADSVPRAARGERAVSPRNFTNSQR